MSDVESGQATGIHQAQVYQETMVQRTRVALKEITDLAIMVVSDADSTILPHGLVHGPIDGDFPGRHYVNVLKYTELPNYG